MTKIKGLIPGLIAAAIASVFMPLAALAIGQISSPIVVDNAIRGQVYRQAISLFNSADTEENFTLAAKGDIAGWMAFYNLDGTGPIDNITIPANSKSQAIVEFKIPDATANGIYEGSVAFSLKAKEGTKERVSQQLSRKVAITVTDIQEISGNVLITAAKTAVAAGTPFEVKASCFNTGNVTIKPTIELDVAPEQGKSIFDVIFPYPKDKTGIMPGQAGEITAQWLTASQALGKYTAHATVVLGNTVKKQDLEFEVVPSANAAAMANASSYIKDNLDLFWLAAGSLIVVAVAVIQLLKRKKKTI